MKQESQPENSPLVRAQRQYSAGELDAALTTIEAPAEAARHSDAIGEAISLTLWESLIQGALGNPDLALARATWCISAATAPAHREALHADAWGVALSFLIFANHARRDQRIPLEKLLDVLEKAERFVESVDRPQWRSGVLSERAAVLDMLGRYDEAVDALEEAYALKVEWPQSPGHTPQTMRLHLGKSLASAERHEEAARLFDAMLADSSLGPVERIGAASYGARSALSAGDLQRAVRLADEACRLCKGLGPNQELAANGIAVEAFLAAGRLEDAKRSAEAVMAQAVLLGTPAARYCGHEDAARVALAQGDETEFEMHMEAIVPLAAAHDARVGFPEYAERIAELRTEWSRGK